MKQIELTQGYSALVDDGDYDRINQFKWYASVKKNRDGSIRTVYGRRQTRVNGKQVGTLLHRFLMEISDPQIEVDHEDGNGLNCQRYNLRLATRVENRRNIRIRRDNTSGFKGVSWDEHVSKWWARIQRKHLGYYVDAEEAARVYDSAAKEIYGEFAKLNFPLE